MVIIWALIAFASALPSDEIQHVAAPGIIDLQHVDPDTAKTFATQNTDLTMFSLRELPNLGHYCAWADMEVQTEATLTDSQQSVLAIPSNNSTEMVYL